MADPRIALKDLIAGELKQPAAPAAMAMAEAIHARHQQAGLAVLFYGSCLRHPPASLADQLLDFYLIVGDYRATYDSGFLAFANRALPPNVFYLEIPYEGGVIRCKYAIISLAQFRDGMATDAKNVSLWARFSQQSRLLWVRDPESASAIATANTQAAITMVANAQPLVESDAAPAAIWQRAFAETYRAELRSEGPARAEELVAADLDRYQRVTPLIQECLKQEATISRTVCLAAWERRRRVSKLLNIARLIKATLTFDGALDYALWKIKRHSGVTLPVTDWQRRHPLLSAPLLAWKLYRRGAFR